MAKKAKIPSLVWLLSRGHIRTTFLAVFAISSLLLISQVVLNFTQAQKQSREIEQALANLIGTSIRQRNLKAIKSSIENLKSSVPKASFCVRTENGEWIHKEEPCSSLSRSLHSVPYSNERFYASVYIAPLNKQSWVWLVALLLMSIVSLFCLSYLRKIANALVISLQSLDDLSHKPHFMELVAAQDKIRERSRLQEERLNWQVNARMGKLLSQVAHDIRSPLTALKVIAQSCQDLPSKQKQLLTSTTEQLIAVAEDLLKKRRSLVHESRQAEDLVQIVQELSNQLQSSLVTTKIELKVSLPQAPVRVLAHRSQLLRALSNITQNSIDALGEQGCLEITLENSTNPTLSIRDDGPGISPPTLSRVFEEGYTWGKENGNGLGLASTKQTLDKHQATIRMQSQLNQGTTTIIEFPFQKVVSTF